MSVRIVVDMNLSVEWIPLLEQAGWAHKSYPKITFVQINETIRHAG